MAASYDGSIRINTKIDQTGAKTGLATLSGSLKKFAAAVAVAFSVTAIVSFTKSCIELASNLNEIQNVVDVTFGASSSKIEEFADIATEQFGLSELAAKQYTGTMGAMLKSMGFATDEAADMSIELASLAGDMASFYNLDTDTAFEKIRSGISGETEPLKQLGVNLSESNLSAYALSEGMATAYSSMSENNKALVRFNYLLSVTSDAQGDFARTSTSWANQVRVLSLNFDALKASLGKGFIILFSPILQMINKILAGLNSAAVVFADFMSALTGSSESATTAITDTADATDDLTDSTTASSEAAKKTRSSFDDLNILSASDSTGTAAGAGTSSKETASDVSDTTSKISDSVQAVADKIKELIQPLKEISFDNLNKSLKNLWNSIKPLGKDVFEGLEWAYKEIFVPFSTWYIEYYAPAFIDAIAAALDFLSAIIDEIKPSINWLWENLLKPIAEWAADKAIDALELIKGAFEQLSAAVEKSKLGEVLQEIGEVLKFLWNYIVKPILDIAWQLIKDVFGAIIDFISSSIVNLLDILDGVLDFLIGIFTGDWSRAWTGVKEIFIGIWNEVKAALKLIFDAIWSILKYPAGAIVSAYSSVSSFLAGVFQSALSGIKNVWGGVTDFFSGIWSGIKGAFGNVADWFKNIFSNAWEAVKNVFSAGGKIFDGIKDGISSVFKTVVNALISGINTIISAPFNTINGMLNTIRSINILGLKPFYSLWGNNPLSVPQIPQLASGAVIPPNRKFIAALGDQKNGTNLETPEDLLRQIVREESGGDYTSMLEDLLSAIKSGFTLNGDGAPLAKFVSKYQSTSSGQGA